MLKRFEERVAPSGTSVVAWGTWLPMRELAGDARAMTQQNGEESGSLETSDAAAGMDPDQRVAGWVCVGHSPNTWFAIAYPPIETVSQTMGPLTPPSA